MLPAGPLHGTQRPQGLLARALPVAVGLVGVAALGALVACGPRIRARAAPPPLEEADLPLQAITEPAQDERGFDQSDLPERWPEAEVLAIHERASSHPLVVDAFIEGHPVLALLDTGATESVVGEVEARRLGLLDGRPQVEVPVTNTIHGRSTRAVRVHGRIKLGRWWADSTPILILPGVSKEPVIGNGILRQLDVVIARDDRRVALLPPGTFRWAEDAAAVPLQRDTELTWVLLYNYRVDGRAHPLRVLMDTGAGTTHLPLAWVEGAAEVGRGQTSGVGGAREGAYYDVGEVVLGDGGPLYAPAWVMGAEGHGALGFDVFHSFRGALVDGQRTLVWMPRARRPAFRTLGPGGRTCRREGEARPCLEVTMQRADGEAALCFDLGPPWAGRRRVALDILAEDEDGMLAWSGSGFHAYLRTDRTGWTSSCFVLEAKHLDDERWVEARLQLTWVHEPRVWPCDEDASCVIGESPL